MKDKIQLLPDFEEGKFVFEEEEFEKHQKSLPQETTLSIKFLSAIGGFIGTLTFMIFLFIAGLYKSEDGMLVLGFGLTAGALFVTRKFSSVLLDTAAITSYVAGTFLMSFGMSETLLANEETFVALFFIVVGIITLFFSPNRFLLVLAVLGILGSISFILFDEKLYVYFHVLVALIGVLLVYINLKEAHFISTGKWALQTFDALRLGLMISFIQLSLFIGKKGLIPLEENQVWLSSLLLLPLLGFVLYSLLNRYQLTKQLKVVVIILSVIIMSLCLFAPAILASLLLVFIMFRVNYKIGFGIALIALVYSIAQYYYDLNLLLLHKSIVLMASGVFFMILFYIVHKKYTEHEQV